MTTDNSKEPESNLDDEESFSGETLIVETDPLVGRRIGNYQVLSVLGRGGFGSVYKAEDVKLGRMVALKFLNQATEGFHSELFQREVKALGILSKHPNIVQIHAWDEFEGKNFFVLEYMASSVADVLARYPEGMPIELAIRIIAESADALAFAHASEILHRDIKSPNILIENEEGPAKIADFGLARICGVSSNTIEGAAIGSPAYMAPEQVRGQELTHLCDIYSLGVTLYELLCGQPPITGTSVLDLLEKVRNNERVPLRERKPGLPDAVYAVIDKATAHDPKDRFGTAKEFAAVLRGIDCGSGVASGTSVDSLSKTIIATPTKKSANGMFLGAVAALLVAIGGGVAYLYSEMGYSPSTDEFPEAPIAEESPPTPAEIDEPVAELESVEPQAPVEVMPAEGVRVEDLPPVPVTPKPEPVVAEQEPAVPPTVKEAVKEGAAEVYEEKKNDVIDAAGKKGEEILDSMIDSIFNPKRDQSRPQNRGKGKKKD